MQIPAVLIERPRYRSDNGVSAFGIPIMLVTLSVAALAVAWLMKWIFVNNWYLIFVVPVCGGLLLAGVMWALVAVTRCRNRWLAGGFGALAGVAAFLGHYQLTLLDGQRELLLSMGNTSWAPMTNAGRRRAA